MRIGPPEPIQTREAVAPRIFITEHGPYKVVGEVAIYDVEGRLRRRSEICYLCRCGGSRHKH
jgi:CDGSH-type Zn-finger protein